MGAIQHMIACPGSLVVIAHDDEYRLATGEWGVVREDLSTKKLTLLEIAINQRQAHRALHYQKSLWEGRQSR